MFVNHFFFVCFPILITLPRYIRRCAKALIPPDVSRLEVAGHSTDQTTESQLCEVSPDGTVALPITLFDSTGDSTVSLTPLRDDGGGQKEGNREGYFSTFCLDPPNSTINFKSLQRDSTWLLCAGPKKAQGPYSHPLNFLLTSEASRK